LASSPVRVPKPDLIGACDPEALEFRLYSLGEDTDGSTMLKLAPPIWTLIYILLCVALS
jgi:hypothetical protein